MGRHSTGGTDRIHEFGCRMEALRSKLPSSRFVGRLAVGAASVAAIGVALFGGVQEVSKAVDRPPAAAAGAHDLPDDRLVGDMFNSVLTGVEDDLSNAMVGVGAFALATAVGLVTVTYNMRPEARPLPA